MGGVGTSSTEYGNLCVRPLYTSHVLDVSLVLLGGFPSVSKRKKKSNGGVLGIRKSFFALQKKSHISTAKISVHQKSGGKVNLEKVFAKH